LSYPGKRALITPRKRRVSTYTCVERTMPDAQVAANRPYGLSKPVSPNTVPASFLLRRSNRRTAERCTGLRVVRPLSLDAAELESAEEVTLGRQ